MKLGSLFSGVEGFGLGFERAGFEVVWQVEREPFCIAVLKKHFPNVERYYEIKDCGHGRKHKLRAVDCITAGVPCQDWSMAGKRAGLAGERSGLFYEFARILAELRPTWFVFENVPGLLSANRGRDFAEILRILMVECGYGVCWRVLDSQFFGVAQHRPRVFVVGRFGQPCPAEVLFENRESNQGDYQAPATTVPCFTARGGYSLDDRQTTFAIRVDNTSSNGWGFSETAYTFGGSTTAVLNSPAHANGNGEVVWLPEGLDSARCRALGNAVTANVAFWIAERIKAATEHG